MQEKQAQSLDQEDPLEEEMATHSVFLPGKPRKQRRLAGYSPRGHRVRHDLATEQQKQELIYNFVLVSMYSNMKQLYIYEYT